MNREQSYILRRAVEFAVAEAAKVGYTDSTHAGSWNQESWAQINPSTSPNLAPLPDSDAWLATPFTCGSTCCIAGNVAADQGYRFLINRQSVADWRPGDDPIEATFVTDGETELSVEDAAMRALGAVAARESGDWRLGDGLAHLFGSSNQITDVVTLANEVLTAYGHESVDVDWDHLKVLNPAPRPRRAVT